MKKVFSCMCLVGAIVLVLGGCQLQEKTVIATETLIITTTPSRDNFSDIEVELVAEDSPGNDLSLSNVHIHEGVFSGYHSPEGETSLVVNGTFNNQASREWWVVFYAEGYNASGGQISWTLDAGPILGRLQVKTPSQGSVDFTINLKWSEDISKIVIYAKGYDTPAP
jgi:hypothetical protein